MIGRKQKACNWFSWKKKKKLFRKIKILVQIGEPVFLNVDDTTLKLCSFPILFFSFLMVSICVCFILREGFCSLHLLKFLNTNNACVKTYFPLSHWTESYYRDTAWAKTVSIIMGNLVYLIDAQTKLAENECRKHSHTVSLHRTICQKVLDRSL